MNKYSFSMNFALTALAFYNETQDDSSDKIALLPTEELSRCILTQH